MEEHAITDQTANNETTKNLETPEDVDLTHFLKCPACRMIDAADGQVDGKVFNLEHWTSPSETHRLQYLRMKQDLLADRVTSFAGSLKFVYIHAVWFGVWILLNVGLIHLGIKQFDKYPFGLLTMIVSLEAIFLATFVMVSQNRQAKRSDMRAQIDFEANLRSLIMITHLAANSGIDLVHVNSIVDLAIQDSHVSLGDETVPKFSKQKNPKLKDEPENQTT